MSRYANIYVLAPSGIATGGVELAHQLVDYLREKGQNAYIVYIHDKKIAAGNVTNEYQSYNIETKTSIVDDRQNILILPEIYFDWMYSFQNITIGFWWMSVDNYYNYCSLCQQVLFARGFLNKLRSIKHWIDCKYFNSIKDLKKESYRSLHFYQSKYAQYHLYSLGFSKVLPLGDYINSDICHECSFIKEDIVLYNPYKGFKFTEKIIRKMPNVRFVALKGYNRKELSSLFSKSKLYIDFGHHPGKDRLPREAAINKCCIITDKRGAASFYEDIPILEMYKYDDKSSSIAEIVDRINQILIDYDNCVKDFSFYVKRIREEKYNFYKNIDDIFM